jgi:hypothetical protein
LEFAGLSVPVVLVDGQDGLRRAKRKHPTAAFWTAEGYVSFLRDVGADRGVLTAHDHAVIQYAKAVFGGRVERIVGADVAAEAPGVTP